MAAAARARSRAARMLGFAACASAMTSSRLSGAGPSPPWTRRVRTRTSVVETRRRDIRPPVLAEHARVPWGGHTNPGARRPQRREEVELDAEGARQEEDGRRTGG